MEQRPQFRNLQAKKLRTGEIVVLDPDSGLLILFPAPSEGQATVVGRVIGRDSFRQLEDALRDVVLLI